MSSAAVWLSPGRDARSFDPAAGADQPRDDAPWRRPPVPELQLHSDGRGRDHLPAEGRSADARSPWSHRWSIRCATARPAGRDGDGGRGLSDVAGLAAADGPRGGGAGGGGADREYGSAERGGDLWAVCAAALELQNAETKRVAEDISVRRLTLSTEGQTRKKARAPRMPLHMSCVRQRDTV